MRRIWDTYARSTGDNECNQQKAIRKSLCFYIDKDRYNKDDSKIDFEITINIIERAKGIYSKTKTEFDEFNSKTENMCLFGEYLKQVMHFLRYDKYSISDYCGVDIEIINAIIENKSNPWDIQLNYIVYISEVLGIDDQELIEKVQIHPIKVNDEDFNSSNGICARMTDTYMCKSEMKNVYKDATYKLLAAAEEKKKKEYLCKLKEYLLRQK